MGIETAVINTTKQVLLNVTNHVSNRVLPNDTINVGVQIPSDHWGLLTALATIFLAIGTWVMAWVIYEGNKKTNKNTVESNNLLRIEINSTMRPILQIENTKTDIVKFAPDEFSLRFTGRLANAGKVPARNIRIYEYQTLNDEIDNIIKEQKDIQKNEFLIGTIQQGGYTDFYRTFPWDQSRSFINLVIWFKFDFLDNVKDECLAIFKLYPDSQTIQKKWYVKEDIDEAIKREKDFRDGKIHSP